MRLRPVLDILRGQVVRGVAGQRHLYKPVESCLTSSSEPVAVASAIQNAFGARQCYVADLDALMGNAAQWQVHRRLLAAGFSLLVDAGCGTPQLAEAFCAELPDAAQAQMVIGVESLSSPQAFEALLPHLSGRRVLFSLDMRHGQLWTQQPGWQGMSPGDVAAWLIELPICGVIVLDIAQVGSHGGPVADPNIPFFRAKRPDWQVISGGGVRNIQDLRLLTDFGCTAVLVASALHSGAILAEDLLSA